MFTQMTKKTTNTLIGLTMVLGLSFSAQASVLPSDISSSIEQSIAKQRAELLKVAKTEIMLSIETQLAEIMNEMSTTGLVNLESETTADTKQLAKAKNTKEGDQ
ncbi:hypothetical protein D5R81_19610 [Parashewanella spongiae]|uniref:Uncharacterized protein n=1 Tax=Parashewanella spongiae TaxID=342950 RepID=A0A3A6SXN0_9GAMM|nr:hypothetical protein [Parashewanella spongiae]MCL1080224.1 hypothetical protein [Parashewanella spongiae]RJY01911.1 hypothetical protein D5R81_19610 [Parashewanella spongiae]